MQLTHIICKKITSMRSLKKCTYYGLIRIQYRYQNGKNGWSVLCYYKLTSLTAWNLIFLTLLKRLLICARWNIAYVLTLDINCLQYTFQPNWFSTYVIFCDKGFASIKLVWCIIYFFPGATVVSWRVNNQEQLFVR